MPITTSEEFSQIERWLTVLITTYEQYPSLALAKTINYYVQRLISHEDIMLLPNRKCDYFSMLRYWQWVIKDG